jgi:hypothetical protein
LKNSVYGLSGKGTWMKKLNEKGFLIAIDIMIKSWNTKVKVKEFLQKKTRVTLRKVRKDTHITVVYQISKTASITPCSINNTKYPLIYPPSRIP